ncbi:hypothetical protein P8887_20020, partial [Bacillus atrophaeus]|nr:hypothetical protein [Bacillus atrophaeus]
MFHNIKRVVLLTLCLMIPAFSALAASFGSASYDSSIDGVKVSYNTSGASSLKVVIKKNGNTIQSSTESITPNSSAYVLRCNASYTLQFLDSSGSVLDSKSINVSQIQKEASACSSDSGSDKGSDSG